MDETNVNLDIEYKRYLEIMQPYLRQLLRDEVIEICNAWITKLSNCKENEKSLRNKYVFTMCYQLAKGVLEEPFIMAPSVGDLPPLTEEANGGESSSELEYLVLNLERNNTKILYDNKKTLRTSDHMSDDSQFVKCQDEIADNSKSSNSLSFNVDYSAYRQNIGCHKCLNNTEFNTEHRNENYQYRVYNLIEKLQEIKNQNLLLREELHAVREQSRNNHIINNLQNDTLKMNTATSVSLFSLNSTNTLKSLQHKLHEVQESRNLVNNKINILQNDIQNTNMVEDNKHKNSNSGEIKSFMLEEIKANYENQIKNLKNQYERTIKNIQNINLIEKQKLLTSHGRDISEKDTIISSKDLEIVELQKCIEDFRRYQDKNFPNVPDGDSNLQNIKEKAEELEKRLIRMEKFKSKCCKEYEVKLANIQKEKHLMECSFHLQIVRQRAQIIHELYDEHQTELATALTKLENKYKEIVANVQSTAIQRRMHDQMALESIIQAVCGARHEGMYTNSAQATCPSQLTSKATRNQTGDGRGNYDVEMPTVLPGSKVGSVIVANKSFGEESVVNDYCLDSEKFSELFEKLYIPQRDTGGDSSKK